jgi:hypothetical protein
MDVHGDQTRLRLASIIEGGIDPAFEGKEEMLEAQNSSDPENQPGMCVECRDQPMDGYCEQCQDDFCDVCYQAQHKRGKRKAHKFLRSTVAPLPKAAMASSSNADEMDGVEEADTKLPETLALTPVAAGRTFLDRSKYIPLRLEYDERKQFRLLEAALNVSEYTDKVDVYTFHKSKVHRMAAQIKEMCAILSGLTIANDFARGQQLLKDHDYSDLAERFQEIFEIGRRYKVNNPDKMRSDFGKLMYLLQDSVSPHVQELLKFNCITPLRTVHAFLEDRDALNVLDDQYVELATREITSDGKTRPQVAKEIKQKEAAQNYLGQKYKSMQISADEIKTCLYSIGDNNSYLRSNRDCCQKMIDYLEKYFHPDRPEEGFVLAISAGRSGARLSHSHARQYNYAYQSLILWREILTDMYKLWYLAEEDLLDSTLPYRLADTGQGLNRIQASPRVSHAIHKILHKVQDSVRDWVGSSVVHLADHNVPNAFFFLTKYLSVAPILNPIVLCLEKIDDLDRDPDLSAYLDAKGGSETVKKAILADFFTKGFDGSGAPNASFFDAGSCIDGRLTSAWNWCSQIEKKPFFPVFLLTGFVGFDGEH